MMIGRLEIVRGFHTKRRWWRYWRPRKLTLNTQSKIGEGSCWCWLGFNFGLENDWYLPFFKTHKK